jgi:hypothetical protein
MEREKQQPKQVKQYDKIFKENMEAALPGIMKYLLGIEVVDTEELPDSIQHTKEREPDVLKKITDRSGATFVLQIELQLENEADMAFRMVEYYIMLARKYKLPVRQHVVFISEERLTMPDQLRLEHMEFRYSLLSLAKVDYRLFLKSEKPEEKILALLADFGGEDPRAVADNIVHQVIDSSGSPLEREKHVQQMHILGKLRKLVPINEVIMESITKYILEKTDIESDLFFQKGLEKGEEKGKAKGKAEVVKNLLMQTDFSVDKIASIAGVTEEFVRKVKVGWR